MKRFAFMTSTFPWKPQEVLMEHTCQTKSEAVAYFNQCYPSMELDSDGYRKSGDITYSIAEFFAICHWQTTWQLTALWYCFGITEAVPPAVIPENKTKAGGTASPMIHNTPRLLKVKAIVSIIPWHFWLPDWLPPWAKPRHRTSHDNKRPAGHPTNNLPWPRWRHSPKPSNYQMMFSLIQHNPRHPEVKC